MKDAIITILKGLWTGGTMSVPGVSGGSMAMILGVYDRLISAVSNIFKDFKKSFLFLLEFGGGGIIGFLTILRGITWLMEQPSIVIPLHFFFLGAVAGGIPIILKSAKIKRFTAGCVGFPLIGILCVVLIAMLPSNLFSATSTDQLLRFILIQLFGGFILAFAFVLPGISTSLMLNMLGLYDKLGVDIDKIIHEHQFMTVFEYIPLGVGVIVGTFLIAKILDKAMAKHPQGTYLIVFGFLLGSLPDLLRELDFSTATAATWIFSILATAIGFAALYMVSRLEIQRIEAAEKAKPETASGSDSEKKEKSEENPSAPVKEKSRKNR